ncbi:hypothetical protein QN360_07150 [Glaciimonas sp. CA11.2]|uniref:hypothetical protein n=1 Tax=Glaciimonas sp. CA11.2 TaxID=3048601 RepID=UPI002B22793D|nr:hypothetical protein [Glaciimonas sp. CA11.2]MEB0162680.1 hypothetical protein [Glaciimonas sp. CA11.2]
MLPDPFWHRLGKITQASPAVISPLANDGIPKIFADNVFECVCFDRRFPLPDKDSYLNYVSIACVFLRSRIAMTAFSSISAELTLAVECWRDVATTRHPTKRR